MEIDISQQIIAEKNKKKAPLNKPFRLPKGSKKKFGVYVKNDKGNIVMVKFGDPNMSIKRDNPARRKAFRSRHSCDDNPGPKWKARYWSCRMWEAKKSVTDYTQGKCGKPNCGSVQDEQSEITLEAFIQAKNKGLWYNIQQKKKRMGKNYRPAPEGSKDRPTQEAIKKAQANDYLNEAYEWDGETEFDQIVFLEDKSLAQVEEVEDVEDEFEDYKEDFYEMIVGSINSIYQHSKNIIDKLNDPMVKENLTEPFLQQQAALAEEYMITIHNYVMFNKENEEEAVANNCGYENEDEYKNMMTTEGQKFSDFLKQCIPTKQGDDKAKFQSCLQDYRNKK